MARLSSLLKMVFLRIQTAGGRPCAQIGLPEGRKVFTLEVVCQQRKDVLWVRTEQGVASYDAQGWVFYDSSPTTGRGLES